MKNAIYILSFILLFGCKTTEPNGSTANREMTATVGDNSVNALVADDAPEEIYKLMNGAGEPLRTGNLRQALTSHVEPVVKFFEENYKSKYEHMYSPRTPKESMLYTLTGLMQGAADVDKKGENAKDIYRVPYIFAQAYYLKGSINISLNNLSVAKEALGEAVKLAPHNSFFLSELGHIYQAEQNFAKALEIFERSVAGTQFSPENRLVAEKGRALRGVGFSLIELGKLDDAEKKFNEALEINPNDAKAKHELNYIKQLRDRNA